MGHDSDYATLETHRRVWAKKSVLRRLYGEQFYQRLLEACQEGGPRLEIGSGPGLLADFAPDVLRSDILASPWVDCAVDAHHLPFADSTFTNVLGLDVLHHFNRPLAVLRELERVLRPGGRLIFVEPWITPFSRLIYTYLHQESCDLQAQPWLDSQDQFQGGEDKAAFDGNAALPYLLVEYGGEALRQALPSLKLMTLERFSSLTYLLSFGFKPPSALPAPLYAPLYALEKATQPFWARWGALRALLVWQKA
jgi:SAM-dependent methyltransferase